ncbi:MAG: hypothetical protein ILA15_00680 [Clostridiales bacterium]|nr:hypothetical protein [Clostridiales bacterium]
MRRISKTSAGLRAAHILKSNDGASIVLVSIIAILVITAVVILRMSTSSLMAGSDKQYRQDQAYMMATSMGASLDNLIVTKTIRLTNYTDPNGTVIITDSPTSIPNSSVTATVTPSGVGYVLQVEAKVAGETYIYSAYYSRAGNSDNFTRQIL